MGIASVSGPNGALLGLNLYYITIDPTNPSVQNRLRRGIRFANEIDIPANIDLTKTFVEIFQRLRSFSGQGPASLSADLARWTGPVLEFYLGRVTADQMMAAAADPDVGTEQRHLCEANFFAGEDALLHSQYSIARSHLEKAVNGCPLKNLHRDAAAAELKRLNTTAESAKPNSFPSWRFLQK
jgi:hypothetical protein